MANTASSQDAVLRAAGWSGTSAPYTQTVPVSIVKNPAIDGYVGLAETVTTEQWNAAALARLRKTAQGNGTITITAEGDRPAIDIPITVVLTGMERLDDLEDRMDALEDTVQGDGYYMSKYSGEEIDALLDKVSAR